ncbi:hypothetical protein BDZ89DRAFT_1146131 [Hymenopellis radicata]|nr:hypothetical protein BDZ89DRAFT_1146131 [Hymenopellis radicata]
MTVICNAVKLAGGFVLIRKDHVSARRTLTQESEWTRVFDVYATGVGLIYPHCKDELQGYRVLIVELFRATPSNPAFPIHCDKETRTRYANSPFNLNDRNALQLPLLTEMLRTSEAANPRKRSSDSSSSQPATRRRIICQNWNLGKCPSPCPGSRVHGTCSECGGKHTAKSHLACLVLLEAKRAVNRAGPSSGGNIEA